MKDTTAAYGTITKVLHWGMALLLLWQFLSAGARYFFEDTAIEAFFWPSHKPLGVVLLVLIVLRLVWALMNRNNRPPSVGMAAKLGHLSLYALVLLTPIVALIRQYGSGRSFEVFGIPVFSGFEGERIEWMMDLGGNFHGEMGWVLLLFVTGHIFMAYHHRKNPNKTDVLPRMWKK
ncbi:cytochrome b/b6 domain-containing protein [Marinicella sp. S1101]|uniref:cytochrome b n=1 Tax=Marinicella marina TaxID=2996016 RepID=UPI002260F8F9|nr:cytochrome b/b6 domain-containing protein [Marinicella marina]MCX7553691.1 cytochrome b/b6 domain-containing protein [Marinicella marina]MDJ1140781.1 cytochrome b/b6 domain-containing protein [Marinicella marina]